MGALRAMPKPNLFIIGAMKAGTSSLHSYLGAHPQIFMTEVKEPAFFEDPAHRKRPKEGIGYWNNLSHYLELFALTGDRPVVGESTTDYTKLPLKTGVARRIFDFNSDARLIYLMRDPIEPLLVGSMEGGGDTRYCDRDYSG
jgi:Sulfotransferase family